MMWKVSFQAALAAVAVAVSTVLAPARAQEAEPIADVAADDALPKPRQDEKPFTALVRCIRVQGVAQVLKPGASEWTVAEERRYYPLGSSFRTVPGADASTKAEFEFGQQASVRLIGAAEVSTRPVEIGEATRTLELKSGRVLVSLPRTLKEGLFFVATPFFTCSNLSGESQFDYQPIGNGDEVVVRCVTGTMTLEGRHYKFAHMAAANQVRIRTTDGDNLISWLRGESGDSKVTLDQGMISEKNFETGESKDVQKTYDFALSPRCAVKIFRRRSRVGGNMVVSTMAFDASGEIKSRCAFAEGRSNVNSGELVIKPVEADAEKKAKAASEETEEVEAVDVKKPAKAKESANADGDAEEEKKPEAQQEEKKDDNKDDDI